MSINLAIAILDSVRAKPTGWQNEGFYQGLDDGQVSGIAIHYYFSDELLNNAENVREMRELLGQKVSLEDCKKFLEFVRKKLHVVIRNNFFTWIKADTLKQFFDRKDIENFAAILPSFAGEFMTEQACWFPLRRVVGSVSGLKHFEVSELPKVHRMGVEELKQWLDKPLFSGATSWLRSTGRDKEVSEARAKCLLSLVALCLHHTDRHSFVAASPPTGSLNSNGSISSSPPLFRSITDDFEFSNCDQDWLNALDSAVGNSSKEAESRKILRSLRFYHSAWFSQYTERFAFTCMAFDALVPKRLTSGSSKCNWIVEYLSVSFDQTILMRVVSKLRGEVLHGDVVSLNDSDVYTEFKRQFDVSPVHFLDEIYRLLIGKLLVGGELPTRRHPLNEKPDLGARYRQVMSNHGISGEFEDRFDLKPFLLYPDD